MLSLREAMQQFWLENSDTNSPHIGELMQSENLTFTQSLPEIQNIHSLFQSGKTPLLHTRMWHQKTQLMSTEKRKGGAYVG